MSTEKTVQPASWCSHPVCCRYVVVSLASLPVQLEVNLIAIDWALGLHASGCFETLGIWTMRDASRPLAESALRELRYRGMERVRFVVSGHWPDAVPGSGSHHPGLIALPSFGDLRDWSLTQTAFRHRRRMADALNLMVLAEAAPMARAGLNELASNPLGEMYPGVTERWRRALEMLDPLYTVSRRGRRTVRIADSVAHGVHVRLARATRRRTFKDSESAVAFIASALSHLEDVGLARRSPAAGAGEQRQLRSADGSRMAPVAF